LSLPARGLIRLSPKERPLYYAKAIPKSVAEEVDKLSNQLLAKTNPQPETSPSKSAKLKVIG
jgi:hypothetical protein